MPPLSGSASAIAFIGVALCVCVVIWMLCPTPPRPLFLLQAEVRATPVTTHARGANKTNDGRACENCIKLADAGGNCDMGEVNVAGKHATSEGMAQVTQNRVADICLHFD